MGVCIQTDTLGTSGEAVDFRQCFTFLSPASLASLTILSARSQTLVMVILALRHSEGAEGDVRLKLKGKWLY